MKIQDFIPPAIISIIRNKQKQSKVKTYKTYKDAIPSCTKNGYENNQIANIIIEKTKIYRNSIFDKKAIKLNPSDSYSILSLLSSVDSENKINVLDFGGGHALFKGETMSSFIFSGQVGSC